MSAGSVPPRGPFLVGVTGPIGSGKSLLCRILSAEHGAPVIDADRLGHEVLVADGSVREALRHRFGGGVFLPDGAVDRPALARAAFTGPAARADLEAIVHPALLAAIARRVAALKESGGAGIILLDAAVLPRWQGRCRTDAVVLVRATQATRRRRLAAKGIEKDEIRRRMEAQAALFPDPPPADWLVVENEGSPEELRVRADLLWAELSTRLGAGSAREGRAASENEGTREEAS